MIQYGAFVVVPVGLICSALLFLGFPNDADN